MDYQNDRDLTEQEKSHISSWLKESLLEYTDECDDVFLEYVLVMVLNGKSMSEISSDLEAFIGEPACSNLALRLGEELRNLTGDPENVTENTEEQQQDQSLKIIKIGRKDLSNDPRFTEGLKSSRNRDGGSSRLVQSALKSTLGPNEKKRSQSRNDPSQSHKEPKRQRVVQIEGGQGRGYSISHGIHGPQGFYPPVGMGMGMGMPTLDPQTMMTMQAQQAGFANVEEMMAAYFQKNMLAMMQSMMPPAVPDTFPGYQQPPTTPHYADGYRYPPRGRGRGGRSFRGAPVRGRGFYPGAGEGRGHHNASEDSTSTVPVAETQSETQNSVEPKETEANEANETTESNAGVSYSNDLSAGGRGFRGRFRGRASGYRGGRGRFAGRAIRGRNKTWVRGPGVEDSLVTDR